MSDAAASVLGHRGTALVLDHCRYLTGADEARPPAYERLELAVGNELARMLVSALADRRTRPAQLAA